MPGNKIVLDEVESALIAALTAHQIVAKQDVISVLQCLIAKLYGGASDRVE